MLGSTAKAGHPWAHGDGKGDRGEGGMAELAGEGVRAREHTGEAVGHSKKRLDWNSNTPKCSLKARSVSGSHELLQKGIHK